MVGVGGTGIGGWGGRWWGALEVEGGGRAVAVCVWGSDDGRGCFGGVRSMQMGGASGGGVVGVGRGCVGVGGWAVVRVALVGECGWGSGGAVRSMVGGVCVVFARHVQLSWVVWHRNWGGLGVCMVQCWCSVLRRCCRSVVILGWVTVRRVVHRVLMRCSREVRCEGRCVFIQVWMARWYPRTNIPQSKLFCWAGRVGVWMVMCGYLSGKSWWVCAARAARVQKCLRSCSRSGYLLLSESR